jgi:hypothetical protein
MWNNIITALSESKDAYMAVFAAVGCYVSIVGLSTWRRQLTFMLHFSIVERMVGSSCVAFV